MKMLKILPASFWMTKIFPEEARTSQTKNSYWLHQPVIIARLQSQDSTVNDYSQGQFSSNTHKRLKLATSLLFFKRVPEQPFKADSQQSAEQRHIWMGTCLSSVSISYLYVDLFIFYTFRHCSSLIIPGSKSICCDRKWQVAVVIVIITATTQRFVANMTVAMGTAG